MGGSPELQVPDESDLERYGVLRGEPIPTSRKNFIVSIEKRYSKET